MKALIIISHPETESFCYDGIYRTIKSTLSENENVEIKTAELYQENFGRDNKELIEKYKEYVSWSTHIYFVSLFGGFVALQNLKYFLMKSLPHICIQFCFSYQNDWISITTSQRQSRKNICNSRCTCVSCINFVCKLCKVAFDYGSLHFCVWLELPFVVSHSSVLVSSICFKRKTNWLS